MGFFGIEISKLKNEVGKEKGVDILPGTRVFKVPKAMKIAGSCLPSTRKAMKNTQAFHRSLSLCANFYILYRFHVY
jgi:hypothetical protein